MTYGFGMVPDDLLAAAEAAQREGRLHWRVTDQHGRSCNGGTSEPLPNGEWSPEYDPVLCRSGWHLTDAPHRWKGSRVWLVEGEGPGGREDDKTVWRRIRPLAEVDPQRCIDPSVWVRCAPDLRYANLRYANLRRANLWHADLRYADLRYANLRYANLWRANLWHADLRDANLWGADLRRADLRHADLRDANLWGADLQRADLRHAALADDQRALAREAGAIL